MPWTKTDVRRFNKVAASDSHLSSVWLHTANKCYEEQGEEHAGDCVRIANRAVKLEIVRRSRRRKKNSR